MKTIEELELLLAESEASDTGVWEVCRGDEDSDIQDSDGQGIAARVADVDARLIVDMRNALPAMVKALKAADRVVEYYHEHNMGNALSFALGEALNALEEP